MVRLRGGKEPSSEDSKTPFQFQDGAIKSKFKLSNNSIGLMFQFQDGAIKSLSPPSVYSFLYVFQFQDGAIKSSEAFLVG